MAKLHCCLVGFGDADALQVKRMAGLARPQLSTNWSFSSAEDVAGDGGCDLLLCDLGSAAGAAAWRGSTPAGRVRAAAVSGSRVFGGLALVKPLRMDGPGGLVHVLNEAARLGVAPPRPNPVASRPAPGSRARPGWLRSLFRAIAAWLSRPTKPRPAQALGESASSRPTQDAPEPASYEYDVLPPGAPAQSRAANGGLAVTTLAAADVAELYEPDKAPDRTLAPRAASAGGKMVTLDAMGCDLLDLLRRARASSQVIVVRLAGIPAICAAPSVETAYTFATLQDVFDSPPAALVPAHVTVARNSYLGRLEVQPANSNRFISVPSFPLRHLFWVATLRCGGADEIERYRDGAFSLVAWPDFESLPHARHYLKWSGMLARRSMTAAALSKGTAHDADEAALFLAACDELGILKRKELPPGLVPAPGRARRALGRATVPQGFLNRLGLQRP